MDYKSLDPKMRTMLTAFPIRNEGVEWLEEEERVVLIYPKNFSKFEKFLHRHLGGPGDIRRPLDEKGTLIWNLCDGEHNVHEICKETYSRFREDIEPVVKRVWGFLEMLLKLNLITVELPDINDYDKLAKHKIKDLYDEESEKDELKDTDEEHEGEEKIITSDEETEKEVGSDEEQEAEEKIVGKDEDTDKKVGLDEEQEAEEKI